MSFGEAGIVIFCSQESGIGTFFGIRELIQRASGIDGQESGIGLKMWREFGNKGTYWVP